MIYKNYFEFRCVNTLYLCMLIATLEKSFHKLEYQFKYNEFLAFV